MLTDFLLIQKMKQGNEQAFDTFVRKYYNEILKYCHYRSRYRICPRFNARNICKFFCKIMHYILKLKTKECTLYTIAGNLCKNYYKKNKEVLISDEELSK